MPIEPLETKVRASQAGSDEFSSLAEILNAKQSTGVFLCKMPGLISSDYPTDHYRCANNHPEPACGLVPVGNGFIRKLDRAEFAGMR